MDAEAPILWPPDAKSQLLAKESILGYWERWKAKAEGVTEDEMVR